MKKTILLLVFSCFTLVCKAQLNIVNKGNMIEINDSIKIRKGDKIKINIPYSYDFTSIEQQKALNLKKIVDVAQIAGVGTSILGSVTADLNTAILANDILTKANQVDNIIWTTDRIESLNASKKAKSLIGKEFIVKDWNQDNQQEGIYLEGNIDNKKYKIRLLSAVALKEIIL